MLLVNTTDVINCQFFDKLLPVTLNFDLTSLLAQVLLFTASTDLDYGIFVVANEKFIDIFGFQRMRCLRAPFC